MTAPPPAIIAVTLSPSAQPWTPPYNASVCGPFPAARTLSRKPPGPAQPIAASVAFAVGASGGAAPSHENTTMPVVAGLIGTSHTGEPRVYPPGGAGERTRRAVYAFGGGGGMLDRGVWTDAVSSGAVGGVLAGKNLAHSITGAVACGAVLAVIRASTNLVPSITPGASEASAVASIMKAGGGPLHRADGESALSAASAVRSATHRKPSVPARS